MQVEKAPLESYADVGGLEQQVMEIKEAVELPLTHPELYQDIGIKPPKVRKPGASECHLLVVLCLLEQHLMQTQLRLQIMHHHDRLIQI